MFRFIFLLLGGIVLASCAAPQLQAVQSFAGPKADLVPLPVAVILIRSGPNQANQAQQLCDGFQQLPTTRFEIDRTGKLNGILPLNWLLRSETAGADKRSCKELSDNYDFARADKILASYSGMPPGNGPFIAMFGQREGKIRIALADGSRFANTGRLQDFPRQFQNGLSDLDRTPCAYGSARNCEALRYARSVWKIASGVAEGFGVGDSAIKIIEGVVEIGQETGILPELG